MDKQEPWRNQNQQESSQGANVININEASQEELEQVQGIGPKRAEDIVQYREQHGVFKNVQELDNISGFAGTLTDEVKQRLAA